MYRFNREAEGLDFSRCYCPCQEPTGVMQVKLSSGKAAWMCSDCGTYLYPEKIQEMLSEAERSAP